MIYKKKFMDNSEQYILIKEQIPKKSKDVTTIYIDGYNSNAINIIHIVNNGDVQ